MPSRAPSICACGKAVPFGVRCPCRKQSDLERKRRFDATRPTARERGYDGKWQKARVAYLEKHPRCIRCDNPATVVDHITPHKGDKRLFWDSGNWQPLCRSCHNCVKQIFENRRLFRR